MTWRSGNSDWNFAYSDWNSGNSDWNSAYSDWNSGNSDWNFAYSDWNSRNSDWNFAYSVWRCEPFWKLPFRKVGRPAKKPFQTVFSEAVGTALPVSDESDKPRWQRGAN
jgi:hypothetical protein